MKETKPTDEEIVTAFETSSQNHGYFTAINGKWVKYEDVFDLINRQKAEIERLTEKTKSQLVLNQTIQTLNEKILAENAELQKASCRFERACKDRP